MPKEDIPAEKKAQWTCDGSPRSWDKFVSWMRHTLIVSTRPVLVYSMVLQRLKTSLFMVLMCQMHSRRLLLLNKDFTSDLEETRPELVLGKRD